MYRFIFYLTEETADLLIEAGKMSWLKPREDVVQTQVKGMMIVMNLNFIPLEEVVVCVLNLTYVSKSMFYRYY